MSGNSPAETPSEANFVNPNPYGGQKEPFGKVYVPRIYGFKVSERARCGPRMKWSRLRPQIATELDRVDWFGRWIGAGAYSDNGEDDDTNEGGQMEDFDPVGHIFYVFLFDMFYLSIQEHNGEEEENESEEEEEENGDAKEHEKVSNTHATSVRGRYTLAFTSYVSEYRLI